MPRSGSNWVRLILDSHPVITCYAALLRKTTLVESESTFFDKLDQRFSSPSYRMDHYQEMLESIFSYAPVSRWVGMKFMLNSSTEIRDHLLASDYKHILLTRANYLAAYASHLLAKSTGRAVILKGDTVSRVPVMFDPQRFRGFCEARHRHFGELRKMASSDMLEIEYNDLRSRGFAKIAEFLDVPLDGFTAAVTAKRGSDDILSRFANPQDVMRELEAIGRTDWVTEAIA